MSIPPFGRGFSRHRVYRSDVVFLKSEEAKPPRSVHRLDEPAGLSLGMLASPQCLLPFCLVELLGSSGESVGDWRVSTPGLSEETVELPTGGVEGALLVFPAVVD